MPKFSDFADLLVTTLAQVPWEEYRNLMLGRSYVARNFFKDAKQKKYAGTQLKFNAIATGDADITGDLDATISGFGRYDGAYDTLPSKQREFQVQGTIDWCSYVGHMLISEKEMLLNQDGKEGYIDIKNQKKEGVATIMANMLEAAFWLTTGYQHIGSARPAILGPEYWVTDDGYAVNDAGGTNHTTVANLDPTSSALAGADGVNRWRNQYKQIGSGNELLDAMDDLMILCRFQAPPDTSINTPPQDSPNRVVFNLDGYRTWQRLMKRLGEPLDPSAPTYNKHKIEYADKMTARSDGTNQGFFFTMPAWRAAVAKGKNMTFSAPEVPPGQINVRRSWCEFWPALWCEDRRTQGKLFGFGTELIER